MWLTQYVGIPYLDFGRTRQGVDCWGLVLLVLKEQYNIVIPEFFYASTKDVVTIPQVVEKAKMLGHKVDAPTLGDIAVFYIAGRPLHTALVLDNMLMLHIEKGFRGSAVESFQSPKWLPRLEGIYRYG